MDKNEIEDFIVLANRHHLTITFTAEISNKEILKRWKGLSIMFKLLVGLNPTQKQKCVQILSALIRLSVVLRRCAYRYANCNVFVCFGESIGTLSIDDEDVNENVRKQ